jgi:hypothetical protein
MDQGLDYIYKCVSLNLLINVHATVSKCFQKFVLACPAVHLHSMLARLNVGCSCIRQQPLHQGNSR